ncbi:hypothetical protein B0H13DRAFT_1862358 [Mycena leptocephala]|nr:hypothetical protein B0H13DRAFT_1862358 [Mycena leptocephala]
MTPTSVPVATARTSTEPSKRSATSCGVHAADAEARSCTPYVPHMTADTTQGDHVYGNETDFPEVNWRARGVRWSGLPLGLTPLPKALSHPLSLESRYRLPSNDSAWARLEGVVGEWCGRTRRSQKRSPKWM